MTPEDQSSRIALGLESLARMFRESKIDPTRPFRLSWDGEALTAEISLMTPADFIELDFQIPAPVETP